MSEHRFRRYFQARRPVPVAASAAGTAGALAFIPVPAAAAVPPAMAQVYRLAYEAALARVIARRRCFAPFSLN